MADGYSTKQLIEFIDNAKMVDELSMYIESIRANQDAIASYNEKFGPLPEKEEEELEGGRRGKKGGRGTKKRKEPAVLASWRKFVRKVQHEENISYPKAMKRASKRKSEWQKGGAVEAFDPAADKYEPVMKGGAYAPADHSDSNSKLKPMIAGKSRRKRGGTKKRRMSRRR